MRGRAPHNDTSTRSLTIGAVVPWGAQHLVWGTRCHVLCGPVPEPVACADRRPRIGHHNYSQLGAIAGWRFRFDEGASPWFVEAGLGGT